MKNKKNTKVAVDFEVLDCNLIAWINEAVGPSAARCVNDSIRGVIVGDGLEILEGDCLGRKIICIISLEQIKYCRKRRI